MFSSTLKNLRQMGRRNSAPAVVIQLTKAEKWKMGITIFTGKILGLFVVLGIMKMLPGMMFNSANA
ncbi:MAG: hypothetical protein WCH78_10800, partial [Bacteroidota bacterium]